MGLFNRQIFTAVQALNSFNIINHLRIIYPKLTKINHTCIDRSTSLSPEW